jgi:protein disulfide-isomerase A6
VFADESKAASLKGLVKVIGIDCDQEANKPLCGSQGIQGFPTIKMFVPGTDSKDPLGFKKRSVDYQGPRTAKGIADFAISQLPSSFVTRIASGKTTLDDWVQQNGDTTHVLLVSAKKDLPPLFKALSTQFRKRAVFAEAKSTDQDVVNKYGLEKFPAIVVVKDGEAQVYDGVMKHEGLHGFISKFVPAPPQQENEEKAKPKKAKEEPPAPCTSLYNES